MKNELIITAATIELAIEDALEQMGARREDVEIEVIEEPVKRFFGEATEAKVRVSLLGEGESEETAPDAEDGAGSNGVELSDEEGIESNDGDVLNDDDAPGDEEDDEFFEEKEKNFNEALAQLTDEEVDVIADTASEIIRKILRYFGVEDATIDEYEGEEGELILDIVGDSPAILIGRHGKTLDSFQFLVSAIVAKRTGHRHPIIVDVEGYKHRRKQKLVSIAKSSASRDIKQKREVSLRSMSPYERRIIHVALKDNKRVTTSSEGTEPDRYVVIRLV